MSRSRVSIKSRSRQIETPRLKSLTTLRHRTNMRELSYWALPLLKLSRLVTSCYSRLILLRLWKNRSRFKWIKLSVCFALTAQIYIPLRKINFKWFGSYVMWNYLQFYVYFNWVGPDLLFSLTLLLIRVLSNLKKPKHHCKNDETSLLFWLQSTTARYISDLMVLQQMKLGVAWVSSASLGFI